jgi:hypothetical protein
MRPALFGLCLLLALGCAQKEPRELTYPTQPAVTGPYRDEGTLLYSVVKSVADPKWLRDPAILGLCSVTLSNTNLEVPCQNVVVAAQDSSGKEHGRASVEAGKFRLSVERGKPYYLRVIAPLYQIDDKKPIGPLKAGETIDLRLSSK